MTKTVEWAQSEKLVFNWKVPSSKEDQPLSTKMGVRKVTNYCVADQLDGIFHLEDIFFPPNCKRCEGGCSQLLLSPGELF